MPASHSFCHACGLAYPPPLAWPRACSHCKQVTYHNPLPVAVVLQPVDDGLLAIRRGVGGKLALPGGFLEAGETWAAGAAREVWEETGLTLDPAGLRGCGVFSAAGDTLLIFTLARPLTAADLPPFVPTAETVERLVADGPLDLAFTSHTEMMRRFFAGLLTPVEGI